MMMMMMMTIKNWVYALYDVGVVWRHFVIPEDHCQTTRNRQVTYKDWRSVWRHKGHHHSVSAAVHLSRGTAVSKHLSWLYHTAENYCCMLVMCGHVGLDTLIYLFNNTVYKRVNRLCI